MVRRHLVKFIYLVGTFTVIKTGIDVYQQIVGLEHYDLINNTITTFFFGIMGLFGWQFYKGFRDCEYLLEDGCN